MTTAVEDVAGVAVAIACTMLLLIMLAAIAITLVRALRPRGFRGPHGSIGTEDEPDWWPEFERQLEEWKRHASGTS
jgi:hypothetical protein